MASAEERYPKPRFRDPSTSGYLYVGISVAPPHAPLVRRSAERDDALENCRKLARRLEEGPEVVRARVFEAVLMPPLKGLPRFDVLMLVETSSPTTISYVQSSAPFQEIGADMVMAAVNPARIGDTESPSSGLYLFNHFRAPDGDSAVRVWKSVAGWYTAKTGIDNSTPLQAVDDARFPFVNYARLPGSAAPFLIKQLLRPSFHRFVRARLKANEMAALPIICKPL